VQVFHQYPSTSASDSVKGNWCHKCFSEEKRDTLECDNTRVRKVDCTRYTNLPEQEEAWVECDHCKRWVHQICGLFNSGRNNANVTYMCPDCLCEGERWPCSGPVWAVVIRCRGSLCPLRWEGWHGREKICWLSFTFCSLILTLISGQLCIHSVTGNAQTEEGRGMWKRVRLSIWRFPFERSPPRWKAWS